MTKEEIILRTVKAILKGKISGLEKGIKNTQNGSAPEDVKLSIIKLSSFALNELKEVLEVIEINKK